MWNNPAVFYIISFLIVIFTLLSLFAKNVIYSLIAAIVVFLCGAVIFYVLGSEYNAIIQTAVYGLAVPVIIGLSIMFADKNCNTGNKFTLPFVAIFFGTFFLLAFVWIIIISNVMLQDSFHITELHYYNFNEVLYAFAKGIFQNYIYGFEILSILLTIVIAGLAIFKRRNS